MTQEQDPGLRKIRRALISVSDKTGIIDFARALITFGVDIISTGGTARALREAGIEVRDVSDVTGFPEMMDGRVKTLHPKIHGALLALRDDEAHIEAIQAQGIQPIDMVVVNLYPFEETIKREGVTIDEAVEQIDIGGPAMIRSAAKNFRDVAIVTTPGDYDQVISELSHFNGSLSLDLREELAGSAFAHTAAYDSMINDFFSARQAQMFVREVYPAAKDRPVINGSESTSLPEVIRPSFTKIINVRYGENPHQSAALYDDGTTGIGTAHLLSGKEMSFNNYVDADAAWQLVCDFEDLACAIIKHTNAAGAAIGEDTEEAYRRALACDPVSAFGGIVAFNQAVDERAAKAINEIFVEVVVAPDFDKSAIEVLSSKKNLRILRASKPKATSGVQYKQISGGMLVQTSDAHKLKAEDLKVVTKRAPSDNEIKDLLFAWIVCKHTKSNAIVYARDRQTVGVGAGQMSRVDSVKIAAMRAQLPVKGAVLASDAFFPFRDGIDEAAKHGITAIIQPGGSMRDAEVIAACDEHGLAMVFTGIRHFRH
ncbi:MAG TPA: bifunctional phosphoribosylaminoimidazolecarboxamide formyltransferase/IMP cyclohydrolase [Pyrinomonadaceae bacterium]|nr:bifunctional phosphoribosylaminoimidazolecarboxamide formyltransferase/IMP cyclohydrolase [Pyrinomonadaceae bacterium]